MYDDHQDGFQRELPVAQVEQVLQRRAEQLQDHGVVVFPHRPVEVHSRYAVHPVRSV